MQTPPYAYPQQLPPPPSLPPDERARQITLLANGRLLSKLAPLVERFAGGPGPGPLLRAPPAPGWVPLRLDTRKVLAFDDGSRTPILWAPYVFIFMGLFAGGMLSSFASRGDWGSLVGGIVASCIAIGAVVGCPLRVLARIRALRAVLARSVVAVGRISARSERYHSGIDVTVEYGYAGAWHSAVVYVGLDAYMLLGLKGGEAYALLEQTPEILVDTANPDRILIKDLYV
jgi:hypothetical protein